MPVKNDIDITTKKELKNSKYIKNSDREVESNSDNEESSETSENESDSETQESTKKTTKKTKESAEETGTSLDKLYSFMQKFRVKKEKWTNTMTHHPFGSYNIPPDKYGQFVDMYSESICDGFSPHINEGHEEYGAMVVDLDFVQAKEHKKRFYTEKTVRNIVRLYNQAITQFLNPEMTLMCYVQEKECPKLKADKYHDGIHLVYPFLCTKPSMRMLIREEFMKKVRENDIFKNIPVTNTLDQIVDKAVVFHNGWMMYGSRKDNVSLPYKLTHIYASFKNSNKLVDTLITPHAENERRLFTKQLIKILSIRKSYRESDMTALADDKDPEDIDNMIKKMKDAIIEKSKKDGKREALKLMGDDIEFLKSVPSDQLVEARNLVKLFSKKDHLVILLGSKLVNVYMMLIIDY